MMELEEFKEKTQKIKNKHLEVWEAVAEKAVDFEYLDTLAYDTLYDLAEVCTYVVYKNEYYLLVDAMWDVDFQYKDARKRTIAWMVKRDFQKKGRTPIGRKPLERVAEVKDTHIPERENPLESFTSESVYKDMQSYVDQVAVCHIPLLESIVRQIKGPIIAPADANGILADIVEREKKTGSRPNTDFVVSGDKYYSGPRTEREIISETLKRGGEDLPVILSYAHCFLTDEDKTTLVTRKGPVIIIDSWPILCSRSDLAGQGPNMTSYGLPVVQKCTSEDKRSIRDDPPFTTNFLLQGPRYQFLDWGEAAQFHLDHYPENQYGSPLSYIKDYIRHRGIPVYGGGSYIAHTLSAWLSKPDGVPAYLVSLGASQISPIVYTGQEVFAGRIYEDPQGLWPDSFKIYDRNYFYYSITGHRTFRRGTRVYYVYPEDCPYRLEFGQIKDITFGQVLAINLKEDHIRFLNNFSWKSNRSRIWSRYLSYNGCLALDYAKTQMTTKTGGEDEPVVVRDTFSVTPLSTSTMSALLRELKEKKIKYQNTDNYVTVQLQRLVSLTHGILERIVVPS